MNSSIQSERGASALLLTIAMVTVGIIVVLSQVTLGMSQKARASETVNARRSFFATESILEDVAVRLPTADAVTKANEGSYSMYLDPGAPFVPKFTIDDELGVLNRYIATSKIGEIVRGASFSVIPLNEGAITDDLQAGAFGILLKNTATIKGQVFSNGPIVGLNQTNNKIILRQNTGYVAVAKNNTAPDPDRHYESFNVKFRTNGDNDNIAQQFLAMETGLIASVKIKICRTATGGTLNVYIKENGRNISPPYMPNAPDDTGSGIAVANVTVTSIALCGVPEEKEITFNPPASVVKGEPYWIVLNHVVSGNGNAYELAAIHNLSDDNYDPDVSLYNDSYKKQAEALWSGLHQSIRWCRPPTYVSSYCDTRSSEIVAGDSVDLWFQIYTNTDRSKMSTLKIEHCTDAGDGDADLCDGTPSTDCDMTFVKYIDAHNISGVTSAAQARYQTQTGGGNTFCATAQGSGGEQGVRDPPFSPDKIKEWKQAAGWDSDPTDGDETKYCTTAEGCDAFGDIDLSAAGMIFPKTTGDRLNAVIPGSVDISNQTLTLRNYTYIKGNLTAGGGSGCKIQVSDTETTAIPPTKSLVIIVDGTVDINNCTITGRINDPLSHLMIVSLNKSITENAPAVWIRNSATGDIFMAYNGLLQINQSGSIVAGYGEWIIMEQSVSIAGIIEEPGSISFAPTGVMSGQGTVPVNWSYE